MTDQTSDNTNGKDNEIRSSLREAGDALLAAGSSIGAAFSKATGELSDKFKMATRKRDRTSAPPRPRVKSAARPRTSRTRRRSCSTASASATSSSPTT